GACARARVGDLGNKPIEPRLGAYGELRITEGTSLAGGAFNYFEAIGDVRGFAPLPAQAVLAARARYGGIWGDIPVTERLFSGGANSQRGVAERPLAPFVPGTTVHPNRTVSGSAYIPYRRGRPFSTRPR